MGLNQSCLPSPHWSDVLIGKRKGFVDDPNHKSASILGIARKAELVRNLNYEKLWDNFLDSTSDSFALAQSDVISILKVSNDSNDDSNINLLSESEIKNYVSLYYDIINKKTIDFMSIYSSTIITNEEIDIDTKIDKLYDCIDLSGRGFGIEELYVALRSFDIGMCIIFNVPTSAMPTEAFIYEMATSWITFMEIQLRSANKSVGGSVNIKDVVITRDVFFDFCNNRQLMIRRIIELLGNLPLRRVLEENVKDDSETAVTTTGTDEILCPSAEKTGKSAKASEVGGQSSASGTVEFGFEASGGDEWMANPAWKKTAENMKRPGVRINPSKPDSNLELDWVYGYRGYDCRNNIHCIGNMADGSPTLYHAAGLSIVQQTDLNANGQHKQFYFGEHSDDVLCMALHRFEANKKTVLIASGEIGKQPAIYAYLYNIDTHAYTTLTLMKGYHKKGVAHVAFSNDGKVLCSIGIEYSIGVYNTEVEFSNGSCSPCSGFGKLLVSIAGPKGQALHVSYCSGIGNASNVSYCFATCGEKHVTFWNLSGSHKAMKIKEEKGSLGSANRNKTYLSIARLADNHMIAGTTDGDLMCFNAKRACTPLSSGGGHSGSVNTLWVNAKGTLLLSGGSDRMVIAWAIPTSPEASAGKGKADAPQLIPIKCSYFKLTDALMSSVCPSIPSNNESIKAKELSVRSICMSPDESKVIIGTQGCQVLECSTPASFTSNNGKEVTPSLSELRLIVAGHCRKELWGLDIRPPNTSNPSLSGADSEFCTVGDDCYLRVWSVQKKKMLRSIYLGAPSRCCAYSPDGLTIAVGLGSPENKRNSKNKKADSSDLTGVLRVYRNDENFTVCFESKEAKQWISEVKYSPDGRTLAIGANDNNVYLYNVNQNYKRKGKFGKHSSGILHLDFTADGKYLQTNCNAYELMFCDASTGQHVTKGQSLLRDADWDTMTCRLSWGTLGIWVGNMDGSDINSVCRTKSEKLLATGDDFGKVKLYRYPAIDPKTAAYNEYSGHSSHVTSVRWVYHGASKEADYLISLGGDDKCVFQWKHIDNSSGGSGGTARQEPAAESESVEVDDALLDMPSGGDEFMAVKPWLGAIVAPTAWTAPDDAKKTAYFAALGELSTNYSRIYEEIGNTSTETLTNASKNVKVDVVKARRMELYNECNRYVKAVAEKSAVSGVSDASAPTNDDLELDWVYGYRGYDCRNNTWYLHTNSQGNPSKSRAIIYHAAALGIVLYPNGVNSKSNRKVQRYFKGHSDDILSMSVVYVPTEGNGIDTLVATGQIGKGNVFVWNAKTLKTLSTLATKQKSVIQVTFSTDKRLIISLGEDNTIVISDWKCQTIMINTKSDPGVCYHLSVPPVSTSPNPMFFVSGDKFMRIYSIVGKNVNSVKVGTTGKGSPQAFWCLASMTNGNYFVGCADGSIYMIGMSKGKNCIQNVLNHNAVVLVGGGEPQKKKKKSAAAVTSIAINESMNRLVSGANDGSIVLWDITPTVSKATAAPTALYRFYVNALDSSVFALQVQSLCLEHFSVTADSPESSVLLVGTRGCDLLEIDISKASSTTPPQLFGVTCPPSPTAPENATAFVMRSHCNHELWGLACHPSLPEYCTAGDDKTLRFYDISSRQLLGMIPIGHVARAVGYHPNGNVVAVGFGGRVGRGKEAGGGQVKIFLSQGTILGDFPVSNDDALKPLAEASEAPKQWISDIKFSPDGSVLAVGGHDNMVHLYKFTLFKSDSGMMTCGVTLKCKFTKHNASISHFDFSMDGRYLQSNCNAYELLFCDTSNGKQITSASQLKDVVWNTWTCALGWPVQGIWADGMDGSDINTVARSHAGHLVASGDDFGIVNLFRYPCNETKASGLKFKGHSSHVMNVRWTLGDGYLISVGGDDKCVFQWKHIMGEAGGTSGSSDGAEDEEAIEFLSDDNSGSGNEGGIGIESVGIDLFENMPSGGDESMAVKPWLGAIRAPKNTGTISADAPALNLKTKWVHGYTSGFVGSSNARVSSNLFFNAEGDAVYPAASLGIKLYSELSSKTKKRTLAQKYFTEHNDDITCLTISPNRLYVATGQTASLNDMSKATKGKGTICIWDASNMTLLSKMVGCHQRSVISLAFSPNSEMLLSVGQDDSHTHTVWSDAGGNWSRVTQVASTKGDKDLVLFTKWIAMDNPMVKDGAFHFTSGGAKGMNFWKLEGSNMSKKSGKFGRKYKQVPLVCAGNLKTKDGWFVVCGTSAGDLLLFDQNRDVVNAVEKAHNGAILSIADVGGDESTGSTGGGERLDCGYIIVTGSKEGIIKIWNQSLQTVSTFDVNSYSLVDGAIGSIDVLHMESGGSKYTKFLAGTYGGEIIEVVVPENVANRPSGEGEKGPASICNANILTDFTNAKAKVLLYSHYKGELWGVATHPIDPDFYATVGDEGTLRIWSVEYNCLIASVPLYWPARAVAWNHSGTCLAVGFHEAQKGGGKRKKKSKKSDEKTDPNAHKGSVHLYSFNRQQALVALKTALSSGTNPLNSTNADSILVKRSDGCTVTAAWISDLKFSPDDRMLAIGSHDKKLYTYNIPEVNPAFIAASSTVGTDGSSVAWEDSWETCLTNKPKFVFNKHSGAIAHFDFTADGKYLQTNCNAYELLFCDASTGKQETSASKLANYHNSIQPNGDEGEDDELMRWESQTCTLGWPVQGIWPVGADGTDINAVDRHYTHKYLATSDDFGLLKLFRYPCIKENSKFVVGKGHSSHVTCVRWVQQSTSIESGDAAKGQSSTCEYLVTTGGNDKCVFVWQVTER